MSRELNRTEQDQTIIKNVLLITPLRDDPLLQRYYKIVKRFTTERNLNLKTLLDIQPDGGNLKEVILQNIRDSDCIIYDLTDPNPNVYYELGFADALNKTIILTALTKTTMPSDISHKHIIFYREDSLETDLNRLLHSTLNKKIQSLVTKTLIKPIGFISFAFEDTSLYHIDECKKKLEDKKDIKEIRYCTEDAKDDFIKFMNKSIEACDFVLLFCSPNAKKSEFVELEWSAALSSSKPIIPIFTRKSHIPALLRSRIGCEYDIHNIGNTVNCMYDRIFKNSTVIVYNRARSESLKNNIEDSLLLLRQSIEADKDYRKKAKEEEDFDNIKDTEDFKEIVGV